MLTSLLCKHTSRSSSAKRTPKLPIGSEDDFRGIIDLIKMKAEIYTNDLGTDILEEDIPAEYLDQAQEYREKLVEAVAETDEELMMKYPKVKKSLTKN